ncbi:MAG TPA: CBS domain-containing protein [Myxococcales bacterium]|nr:CBS domain-containing protein [Myxococcales bacterium]HET9753165.1 CBS domain-containing protein [Myxococcales bacterium]
MTRGRVSRLGKRNASETAADTPVSRIMSRDVITVHAGTSLESVIELMLARGLSRMPVVDERHRPVGIISKTDVVEESHDRDDLEELPRRGEEGRGFHLHREGATVDEVMTPTVLSVPDTATVEQVAELMVSRHVHGLPVVDSRGELAGFVSTMDVLAWLAGLR